MILCLYYESAWIYTFKYKETHVWSSDSWDSILYLHELGIENDVSTKSINYRNKFCAYGMQICRKLFGEHIHTDLRYVVHDVFHGKEMVASSRSKSMEKDVINFKT